MKLGFVCTNRDDVALVRAAIASLHAGGCWADLRVVVVDDASQPAFVAGLKTVAADYPGVDLILNRENIGYFKGLNIGIAHLRATAPDLDAIVVGNNDLEFPPDFVAMVESCEPLLRTWAVLAPDVVTPDGMHQNPHVRAPIGWLRRAVWDLHFTSYALAGLLARAARLSRRLTSRPENVPGSQMYRTPGPVEQGYGACYVLGPVFFRHFRGLCAPTFMLQEEFFLYEQLKTIGQLTYYEPRIVVSHRTHSYMGKLPSRRHWAIAREAHRVYKRYLRMSPAEQAKLLAQWSVSPAPAEPGEPS